MKHLVLFVLSLLSFQSYGYDFKGYEMGITLSEFKSKGSHKDSFSLNRNSPEGKLVCSDESPREINFVFRLEKYPTDSVILCRFQDYMNLTIGTQTYSIDPTFIFVKISKDGDFILTLIDFQTPSSGFKELVNTLKVKYKNPISSTGQNVQNMMGSQFRNETIIWRDKTSEIEIQKYADSINVSQVFFVHLQGEKVMKKLENSKKMNPKSGF